MGASISSTNKGGGRRARRRYRPLSEINVTPFVDVMLVLLIVFMVTAPLLTTGVQIDLPKASANALPEDAKPIEITLDQNGAIFLQDTQLAMDELIPRMLAISNNRKDMRIYVRGDRRLDYGSIMTLLGALNKAGFTKVALQSEPLR